MLMGFFIIDIHHTHLNRKYKNEKEIDKAVKTIEMLAKLEKVKRENENKLLFENGV